MFSLEINSNFQVNVKLKLYIRAIHNTTLTVRRKVGPLKP